jgi:hypothetical protein
MRSVGFDTKALKVRVERASTRLVETDHAGHVISEDAPGRPAEFTGPRDAQGGEFIDPSQKICIVVSHPNRTKRV